MGSRHGITGVSVNASVDAEMTDVVVVPAHPVKDYAIAHVLACFEVLVEGLGAAWVPVFEL